MKYYYRQLIGTVTAARQYYKAFNLRKNLDNPATHDEVYPIFEKYYDASDEKLENTIKYRRDEIRGKCRALNNFYYRYDVTICIDEDGTEQRCWLDEDIVIMFLKNYERREWYENSANKHHENGEFITVQELEREFRDRKANRKITKRRIVVALETWSYYDQCLGLISDASNHSRYMKFRDNLDDPSTSFKVAKAFADSFGSSRDRLNETIYYYRIKCFNDIKEINKLCAKYGLFIISKERKLVDMLLDTYRRDKWKSIIWKHEKRNEIIPLQQIELEFQDLLKKT